VSSHETEFHDPESPLFRKWAEFILKHRWYAVAITFVLTGLSIYAVYPKPKTDLSVEAFLASKSEELKVLEEYRTLFGRDDMFLVVAEAPKEGGVFTMPFLNKLKGLHDELGSLNLEIPSLGQCVSERRQKQLAASGGSAGAAPKATEQQPAAKKADANKPAPEPKGSTASEAKDDFGDASADDFGDESADDFGDESADDFGDEGTTASKDGEAKKPTKKLSKADAEWGNEGGGTIVDEITSLINARRTRGKPITLPNGKEGVELEVGEFMDPWPDESQLSALKAEALGDRTLVGRVVNHDGTYAVIVVRTQCMAEADSEGVYHKVQEILGKYRGDDFKLYLSGPPALVAGLNGVMLSEMGTLFGLAMLCFIFMMGFIFRHFLGIVGPMAIVFFASVWTFGFMAVMGYPMTMLTTILPTFIICVGIGDTVHLVSVYRDKRKHGVENNEAIAAAIASTAKPILFTTMTTAVGLLSFRFASIDAIQEMGTAGAAGVFMAFANTIIILPALLSLNKKSVMGARTDGSKDFIDKFLDWCIHLSVTKKKRNMTLIGAAVLSGIAVYGALQLRVHHNPLDWMPDDLPTKVAFDKMDNNVGGTATIQLLMEPKDERGMKHHELLLGLEKLDKHIKDYVHDDGRKIVTNSISIIDIIKETNQALSKGDPAAYALPETQDTVGEAVFQFEMSGPAQLRRMATADLKKSQMTLSVRWMEATSYRRLVDHVDKGIEEHIGDKAVIKTTGAVFTLVTTVGTLISNLMRSFGMAFLVITFLMMVLLNDVRLGLIAMVPNLMPIALIMGLMAALNIPIDMANLLIASIAMGLAVDDTIHFLHHFKAHYDINGKVEAAIEHSMQHSGRALVSTTLILSVGFFVFLAAQLSSMQRFGGLIGTTVILALLVDLMFGPALLRLVYKDKDPQAAGARKPAKPVSTSADGGKGVADELVESIA